MTGKDYIDIHYIESRKSKKWIDKHIPKREQSLFIREAVEAYIAILESAGFPQVTRKRT